jgi:mono/diheme cytochrome c family protein
MKKFLIISAFLAIGLGLMVACQSDAPGAAVPDEYAGMENPYIGDVEAVSAGQMIYEARCIRCHGPLALGEGEATGLNPPPSDLVLSTDMHEDDYLFWRTSEGGKGDPVESAMPAFKTVLSADEIWQVLAYLEQME